MTRRAAAIALVLIDVLLAVRASAQSFAVEKFTLKNGMTVILYPDHSLPVAAVNIWYRVGSKDEPLRRSGFAHLFEHLMFMGTKNVPNGSFDTIMEAAGGANNASTSDPNRRSKNARITEILCCHDGERQVLSADSPPAGFVGAASRRSHESGRMLD